MGCFKRDRIPTNYGCFLREVVVIGLSIDYCVHMSEAYTKSHETQRFPRVIHTFEAMGISVLSSSLSTLGASFFMFFAPVVFFVKFAAFIFVTISLSTLYALLFFPAVLSIVGPTGDFGNLHVWIGKKFNRGEPRQGQQQKADATQTLPLETINAGSDLFGSEGTNSNVIDLASLTEVEV